MYSRISVVAAKQENWIHVHLKTDHTTLSDQGCCEQNVSMELYTRSFVLNGGKLFENRLLREPIQEWSE